MEFKFIDLNGITEEELIEVLDHNARCSVYTKREIDKLRKATAPSNSKIVITKQNEGKIVEKCEKENSAFEKKVIKHLQMVKDMDIAELEDNIYGSLPTTRDYDYEKIIKRLILEFKKEINDINEIVVGEYETLSKEDLEYFSSEIKLFQKRIDVLKKVLKEEKEEVKDDDIDNTLVFIPTQSGNPRLLDDLKSIPSDFYDEFLELFISMIDGTFKKCKRFNMNKKLNELREVKGDHLRITYVKLGKNTYGVLTAFMKKTNSDHGYRNMLYTRYKEYKKNVKDKLEKTIENPSEEFLKYHKDYQIEVFRMLGIEDEKDIQKIKRGNE